MPPVKAAQLTDRTKQITSFRKKQLQTYPNYLISNFPLFSGKKSVIQHSNPLLSVTTFVIFITTGLSTEANFKHR